LLICCGHYRFLTTIELDDQPVSLVHHKTQPNDLPIYVRVVPDAIVTVGRGPPPDPDSRNIDEG